jgi:hypothetical protein
MNIALRGATVAVDREQRVNVDRLRTHRLARAKAALAAPVKVLFERGADLVDYAPAGAVD